MPIFTHTGPKPPTAQVAIAAPKGFGFRHFLDDTANALVNCLRLAGFQAFSNAYQKGKPDRLFILGAHLWPEGIPEMPRKAWWVQTENLYENYAHSGTLDTLVELLFKADGVLDLFPGNVAFLRERGVNAHLWQYYPGDIGLPAVPRLPRGADLFDACFIGSITPYRQRILSILEAKHGASLATAFSLSHEAKFDMHIRSRYALSLPYDESYTYTPWPRIAYAVEAGCRSVGYAETGSHLDSRGAHFDCREPEALAGLIAKQLQHDAPWPPAPRPPFTGLRYFLRTGEELLRKIPGIMP